MACGIYRIVNIINRNFYVGSTDDFSRRENRHFLGRKSAYENIKKAQLFNINRTYTEEHKNNISIGKIKTNREKILETVGE